MKVLMFGWEFPPHISGGLGTACYGLAKGITHTNLAELIFVVPKAFGDEDNNVARIIGANQLDVSTFDEEYLSLLKKIHYIEVNSNIVPYTSPEEFYNLVSQDKNKQKKFIHTSEKRKLTFTGKYGPGLFQEIADYSIVAGIIAKQQEFDIIHAHDWLTYPAGIAAKEVSGKPLVVHVHATDFDRSGGSVNPAVFELEKKGMEAADKVITVSNLTRNIVVEKYGINPDKVVTIHNAVEPIKSKEEIKLERGITDKIVTFLGRITIQKGPEYFVEAAHRVLQKMDNVRFVMAGSGELLERMVNRAAELSISHKFHFTGFLSGDDVYKMFSISDVYVMPSVSEPFGISPLEAMQSNVPVIISKQSGVAEILKHAVKVDFWDINGMADAIYGILNYPGAFSMFSEHAKTEVENLKWETTAKKLIEEYKTLLNK